ncbi:MAG: helix-turn-helix domain-containing protein [Ruminococcaceae bacterium]|nr:helix-turn-helix domain-containing protein [Oscillospiraceae bacterium]
MSFSQTLTEYMKKCGCNAKELAAVSGVSPSSISRYKSGERVPSVNSKVIEKLASGIAKLDSETDAKKIYAEFTVAAGSDGIDTKALVDNLNTLMNLLAVSNNKLAQAINYDPSHLSRIRSGSRNITKPQSFASQVSEYIVNKHCTDEEFESLKTLTGSDGSNIKNDLYKWLCSGQNKKDNSVSQLLYSLETFNLDEYIEAIHFNDIKVPTLPFSLPTGKMYYGKDRMKQCELDFFKTTFLSRARDSVFMCSDMPMASMANDLDFDKKWMMSIAVMLKKGLRINIIHNLDRPWNEMMLGLQAWIPIYMTGQVHPYYFKSIKTNIYHHINYVSGAAAMSGECVDGFFEDGKYYLTKNKDEIAYYRKKADDLLKKASPLMEIYTADRENEFAAFTESEKDEESYLLEEGQKVFKNIEIRVCHGKWVLITKKSHPYIHFVIRHPRLMQAIENFSAEIEEN